MHKKLFIGMVGLPARGKTHIAFKVHRYLSWLGYRSEIFTFISILKKQGIDFNPVNYPDDIETENLTEQYTINVLRELVEFLKADGEVLVLLGGNIFYILKVAIFNATNYSIKLRSRIQSFIMEEVQDCQIFWVESTCNNQGVVEENIRKNKIDSLQYKDFSPYDACQDFFNKIQSIAAKYESVDLVTNTSYIKLVDIGDHIFIHQLDGFLQSKIVSFLMNLHISQRPVYFCRTGECQFNEQRRVGGDSDLTEIGLQFAYHQANFFMHEFKDLKKTQFKILTSTMKRAITTSEVISKFLGTKFMSLKTLDELDYGLCDGMLLSEIAEKHADKVKEREKNKLTFRFPRGESYLDVINRIEPIIFEIERIRTPLIIVAHEAILRCLYAYLHYHSKQEIPELQIPSNVIIKLLPGELECLETRITLDRKDGNWVESKIN